MSRSINYHREGDGPPLVLLHGVGLRWQIWQPVIVRLASEFDVIACDSPGFGRSAPLPPSIEPTIAAYVDAFEWFFAELGIERPHVAGISMGGAIGLELARARSVRSVSAFSPIGFWTSAERSFCQRSLTALLAPAPLRPLLEALVRTRRGHAALCWQYFGYPQRVPVEEVVAIMHNVWTSPAFAGAVAAFGSYRFSAGEQLRSTPLTIAWGRRDRLLPRRLQAPRARALLPQATHVTLGTGHVPTYDDPAAVAEVIRSCARSAAATDTRTGRL